MSKWYTVKVTSISMVLVEVDDEEDGLVEMAAAQQIAMDNSSGNDLEASIEDGPMAADSKELESAKRHADEVLSL